MSRQHRVRQIRQKARETVESAPHVPLGVIVPVSEAVEGKSYKELQAIAKARGLKHVAVSKASLIESLR